MKVLDRARKVKSQFSFRFLHLRLRESEDGKTIIAKGKLKIFGMSPWELSDLVFFVGDMQCDTVVSRMRKRRLGSDCIVRLMMDKNQIFALPIHNVLKIRYLDADKQEIRAGVMFDERIPLYLAKRTRFILDEELGLVAFFRQNAGKGTTFTVRHANATDSFGKQLKLFAAWMLSKMAFWVDPVLIYEKNCHHYEESGSVLYESLIDREYSKINFVLDREIACRGDIAEKYRRGIVYQHSFKHYLLFFRCRRFLGTESMAHALELRCQNIFVQRKLKRKDNRFVFLQHGVMYMVSLDSPQRSSFKRKAVKGDYYVVASSELEASHFVDLAGFERDEIIVSGLPKFDRSFLNPGANKILIMPTWRIWEFNEMRQDPQKTAYVRMINRIIAAIPEELREHVVVANHPLFSAGVFEASPNDSRTSYDELLRDVSLLITDYSSIAFDAFYRGANVIFYWEEMEECMRQYGGDTHLMLSEESAFGPCCYRSDELRGAVESLYGSRQREIYLRRFGRIVEHHDGKNTDRLIAELRRLDFIG